MSGGSPQAPPAPHPEARVERRFLALEERIAALEARLRELEPPSEPDYSAWRRPGA